MRTACVPAPCPIAGAWGGIPQSLACTGLERLILIADAAEACQASSQADSARRGATCHSRARSGQNQQTSSGSQTARKPALTREAAADSSTRNDLLSGRSRQRAAGRLTTNVDHNGTRFRQTDAGRASGVWPGERRQPTTCAYLACRRSGVRIPLAPPGVMSQHIATTPNPPWVRGRFVLGWAVGRLVASPRILS